MERVWRPAAGVAARPPGAGPKGGAVAAFAGVVAQHDFAEGNLVVFAATRCFDGQAHEPKLI